MKQGRADPRLVLKVTPPRVPKTAILRDHLSSDSPALVDKSFIIVEARSGFGKTTLLAQWRREAFHRGAVVAWLTADEWDRPERLVAGLALAMKMASGRAAFGQIGYAPAAGDDAALESLTEWLSEVVIMATEAVLIIDDAHLLPPISANESLAYLLHNAPANLKVILGARSGLGISVADWVAHGQFAALSVEDLRLRLPETMALLTARFGNRIDADACARLHELTEGWPLGLQLVVATIEKNPNLPEAIDTLSARSGDIRRYFVECLIDRLSPDLVDFVVRIAINEDIHPELCQAITGRMDSSNLLARLAEATPIFARGIAGDWLRIHPLARDFLLERLALFPLAERKEMHLHAAAWLVENGMIPAASRHYEAAGETRLVYDLAEIGLFGVVAGGQVAMAADWLQSIPQEEVMRRPRLRLSAGWLLALGDRSGEATGIVEPMIADESLSLDERCEAATICSAAAYFADDLVGVERIITPWIGGLHALAPMLRANLGNQIAALMLYSGAPERTRQFYQRGLPAEVTGLTYIAGWADWQVGISYLWEGQPASAEKSLRASLERAEYSSGRRTPVTVMLASALATALWDLDRLEEANVILANRLDILERHACAEAIIMGIVTAARLAAAGGLERRAYDLLDNLCSLGEARALPRLCVASLGEQIRMHALRGRVEACTPLVARLAALPLEAARLNWGDMAALLDIQLGLAQAYAAAAGKDWPQVLALLDTPGRLADQRKRGRDALQIRLLRALARKRCGDDGGTLLAEAVSLAEMSGLKRILADTHPDLPEWAHQISHPEPSGTDDRIAEAPAIHVRPASTAKVLPSSLLTAKEQQILQLLAGTLTNKQIALALGVGDQTIKWHLKNLFAKLGAGTRRHALDRARMLGILETAN